MTFSKRNKAIGALLLTLAAVTTLSVSAFAQETNAAPMAELEPSIPMAKLAPSREGSLTAEEMGENSIAESEIIDSIPAIALTEAQAGERPYDETTAIVIETRTNEETGELEVSEDGGKTWTEFDGKAIKCTMALTK